MRGADTTPSWPVPGLCRACAGPVIDFRHASTRTAPMSANDLPPPHGPTQGGPLGRARWADPANIADRFSFRELLARRPRSHRLGIQPQRASQLSKLRFQCRQIPDRDHPDGIPVDVELRMCQRVAHADDLSPRHLGGVLAGHGGNAGGGSPMIWMWRRSTPEPARRHRTRACSAVCGARWPQWHQAYPESGRRRHAYRAALTAAWPHATRGPGNGGVTRAR